MPVGDDQKNSVDSSTQRLRVADAPPLSEGSNKVNVRQTVKLNPRAEHAAKHFNTNSISPKILVNSLRMIEFLTVFAIGCLVYLTYVFPNDGFAPQYFVASSFAALLTIIAIQATRGYEVSALRRAFPQWGRIFGAWAIVFSILSVLAIFMRVTEDFSRVWFASWFVLTYLFLCLLRSLVAIRVRRWANQGRLERRAVVVGGGKESEALINALETQRDSDIRICGIFDDRQDERSPEMVAGIPKLGTVAELVEFGRRTRIDLMILSLPLAAENRTLNLLKKLWVLPVDIRLSAHDTKLRFRPRSYSYIGSVPFLDVFDKPIADWDSVLKRGFDIVFSLLGIVALSPVLIGTAIAVKLTSPGPVLFRQKRFGFKNEVIDVMKFRSMYIEHEDKMASLSVTRDDPRVTPIGRFIRKTSIDELPQLFNVLSGELSLVGPRPHAVNAHTKNQLWDEVIDGYFGRHRVKPGVTGWAQINGWRGEVDTEEKLRSRVEHDLYYIENWSVWFDLYICLATPMQIFKQENAY